MDTDARVVDDHNIREEVFADIKDKFGLEIQSYTPVFFGLFNMKWIVTTQSEKLFIKCYHPKRYKLSEPKRKLKIERSLSFQQALHHKTAMCPGIWHQDDDIILITRSGH